MDPTSPHFTPRSPHLVKRSPATLPVRLAQAHPLSHESSASGTRSPATRKIFNCIVDETALIQGTSKSAQPGLCQWVAASQIRLFVPLYALAHVGTLKQLAGEDAADAAHALEWLDESTSAYPHLVALQGGYERFGDWRQVQRFLLPKPLFSAKAQVTTDIVNGTSNDADDHSVKSIDAAPATVTDMPNGDKTQSNQTNNQSSDDVPVSLRPLLDYILWRIHQENDPTAALNTFLFLTDDPIKQQCAQRFGIRTKTLSELRNVIAKEGPDVRGRENLSRKESIKTYQAFTRPSPVNTTPIAPAPQVLPLPKTEQPIQVSDSVSTTGVPDDEEDEVLLHRTPTSRPQASQAPQARGNVIDPNQFTRNFSNSSRGTRNARGSPGIQRGPSRGLSSPRGGHSTRGRVKPNIGATQDHTPIDPDSFSRSGSEKRGSLRGTRRLWNPV